MLLLRPRCHEGQLQDSFQGEHKSHRANQGGALSKFFGGKQLYGQTGSFH